MLTSGFQATQFGYAVDEVNKMLKWRLSDELVPEDANEEERDPRTCRVRGPNLPGLHVQPHFQRSPRAAQV